MPCGRGNLYNFRQYYRLIYVELFLSLYNIILDLSSLEILERTKYVQIILHHGFYNVYDLIKGMKQPLNLGSFHVFFLNTR